jgi:hypothetical protein
MGTTCPTAWAQPGMPQNGNVNPESPLGRHPALVIAERTYYRLVLSEELEQGTGNPE